MRKMHKLALFIPILFVLPVLTYAEEALLNESRGQLLYMTHCTACHTTQMHWRENKLAIDWAGLVAQVRRWQNISGYNWSEEEINDVSNHLNSLFYGYQKNLRGQNKSQLMYKNNY